MEEAQDQITGTLIGNDGGPYDIWELGMSKETGMHSDQGYLTAFCTVTDRCSGRSEMREVVGDAVLKAEIYELLNETDCTKVSFEEIVSLLEERLQTNLQDRKAHISDLVCEVTSIGKLLEKERTTDEVESQQIEATGVCNDLSRVHYTSSSRHLGKLPFSYDCP